MTREERELAIYCLKASSDYHSEVCEACVKYPNCDHTMIDDMTEVIIKALEQQPCEDAISREDALMALTGEWTELTDEMIHHFIKHIKKLPPVNPQPKIGHWSRKTKVDAYDIAGVKTWGIKCQCDKCDFTTIVVEDFGYYKYCPNCGARMAESEE